MEFLKFRYDSKQLIQTTQEKTGQRPIITTKKLDNRTIQYLKIGNEEALPLVVFVHGSPGALNAYEEYFSDPTLLEKMNMIAVDRPGFGFSDFGKTEPSLLVQAELIATILKDFPKQKKILVGHSMGGPVIAKTVMEFPELVDGLVMVAPSISPADEPSNTWRRVLNFPLIRWFTPPALRVCNQEIIPLKTELELMMDEWKNINVPLTVVQGTEDNLVPMENALFAEAMMKDNIQVKKQMIEGGDHFILWSELPLVKEEILEVINKSQTVIKEFE